jgi:hypothetical protein
MKQRWSIWVREHGSDHDVELLQVGSNPEPLATKLRDEVLTVKKSIFEAGKRKSKIPKYDWVRIVENRDG